MATHIGVHTVRSPRHHRSADIRDRRRQDRRAQRLRVGAQTFRSRGQIQPYLCAPPSDIPVVGFQTSKASRWNTAGVVFSALAATMRQRLARSTTACIPPAARTVGHSSRHVAWHLGGRAAARSHFRSAGIDTRTPRAQSPAAGTLFLHRRQYCHALAGVPRRSGVIASSDHDRIAPVDLAFGRAPKIVLAFPATICLFPQRGAKANGADAAAAALSNARTKSFAN